MTCVSTYPNINNQLDKALKEKGFKALLPLITCTLHVIHSGFQKGLNSYGYEVEELAFDLYYWFRIALCKREDF